MDFITEILKAAVRSGTPLLYATLGEILTERSGVLNLGLEGLMLMGAISGFAISYLTGNLFLALIVAFALGGVLAFVHAFFTISLRVNQVVSGLAVAMLGSGISGFWGRTFVGKTATQFHPLKIPLLANIPIIGPSFFNQDIMVYMSYILVPLLGFWLYKTKYGLTLRAVGEKPGAADARGVNVSRVRYIYTVIGGAIVALGGAYLSLAYTSMWVEEMSAGRGWIAIALVIFATWDPYKALAGAYLFGGIASLQLRMQAWGVTLPSHIMMMFPYIATLIVLVFTSSEKLKMKLGAPSALGEPYSREERN